MLCKFLPQAAIADAKWTAAGNATPVHHKTQIAAAAHGNRNAVTAAA